MKSKYSVYDELNFCYVSFVYMSIRLSVLILYLHKLDCPDDPGVEEFIIPMDRSVLELGLSGDSNQTNGGQETGFSATSQLVLVCSWRCMKEVSLLLGDLVERFPLLSDESKCLLTVNQVELQLG